MRRLLVLLISLVAFLFFGAAQRGSSGSEVEVRSDSQVEKAEFKGPARADFKATIAPLLDKILYKLPRRRQPQKRHEPGIWR